MPLARGTRLGPYEILGPLGAGGMGEVWRARDTKLARDVALKVLPDHLSDDSKALARFENEAKAVAALSHPHILAIHDFGRIDGVSFVVTELLEGETLRAAASPRPASPPQGSRRRVPARRRPRRRAREGDRPPRRQARERHPHEGRPRQAPRLRPRAPRHSVSFHRRHTLAHRLEEHRPRHDPRHGLLHVARAGAGPPRGLSLRPVLPRRRPLRDALGQAPLPRPVPRRDPRRRSSAPSLSRSAPSRPPRPRRSAGSSTGSSPRTPPTATTRPATSRATSRRAGSTSPRRRTGQAPDRLRLVAPASTRHSHRPRRWTRRGELSRRQPSCIGRSLGRPRASDVPEAHVRKGTVRRRSEFTSGRQQRRLLGALGGPERRQLFSARLDAPAAARASWNAASGGVVLPHMAGRWP